MRLMLMMVTGVLLTGCTFISFPVIPDPVSVELPVVPKSQGLILLDKTLSLKVSIPSGEGFVGVIWYQQDRELGRESIYIDEKLPEVTFKQAIDTAKPHRAVLLYQKKIIRQYEYLPPKVEEPEKPAVPPTAPQDPSKEPPRENAGQETDPGGSNPPVPPPDVNPENPDPTDPAGQPPEDVLPADPPQDNPAGETPAADPPADPGDSSDDPLP